jgi:hypothetical protein
MAQRIGLAAATGERKGQGWLPGIAAGAKMPGWADLGVKLVSSRRH